MRAEPARRRKGARRVEGTDAAMTTTIRQAGAPRPAATPGPAMRAIPGGAFLMGSDRHYPEEGPARRVRVSGFEMDETAVTNRQFAAFVAATGYVTVAEQAPDPALYPGAPAERLVPGSLVFRMTAGPVDTRDPSQWWAWTPGACWRRPEGPDSSVRGRKDHPVLGESKPEAVARAVQSCLTLPFFRTYTSDDVTGVEWAGAMKTPYAIAAGVALGLRLGDNAIAALVTRALAEMVRLGTAMGGRVESFYGLAGVGDLMGTCYSEHSRNHRLGRQLGEGRPLAEILGSSRMVTEGVPNTASLHQAAKAAGVRTPLLDEVHAMLYEHKPAPEALRALLSRDPRAETE